MVRSVWNGVLKAENKGETNIDHFTVENFLMLLNALEKKKKKYYDDFKSIYTIEN